MGFFSGIAGAIGGLLGARAADKASDRYADALTAAGQTLEGGGLEYEKRLQPISGVAPDVMQRLQDILLKGDMSKFYESPDYQYRLQTGRDVIQGSAAANKMLMSGKTLKALERFGQEEGSKEFSNVLSRLGALFSTTSPYYETYAGLPYTMAADKANIQSNIGAVKAQGVLGKAAGQQQFIGGIGSAIDGISNPFSNIGGSSYSNLNVGGSYYNPLPTGGSVSVRRIY